VSWEEHLLREAQKRQERRNQAQQKTESRRKAQAAHVRAFLPRWAEALRGAADTYNRAVSEKIKIDGPRKGSSGETFDISLQGQGFRFEDSGKGFIRIFDIVADQSHEYAFVQPVLNKPGDLKGWHEKQVFPGGKTFGRSLETLTEEYLLATVRRRLLQAT